jgi:hypothetical protein
MTLKVKLSSKLTRLAATIERAGQVRKFAMFGQQTLRLLTIQDRTMMVSVRVNSQ